MVQCPLFDLTSYIESNLSIAGKMLRSHIKGNRALLVTNDLLAPIYLEKYERLLKEGGNIQIGKDYEGDLLRHKQEE